MNRFSRFSSPLCCFADSFAVYAIHVISADIFKNRLKTDVDFYIDRFYGYKFARRIL